MCVESHVTATVRANCATAESAIAIVDGAQAMSYRDLGRALDSGVLALRCAGVVPGDIVEIRARRVASLPVAVLSVWEVGATAVIVDATQPLARLREYEDVAGPDWRLLLSDRATFEVARTARAAGGRRAVGASHILFTSGTTGRPAAVEVSRDAFDRVFRYYLDEFRPGPGDRVALLAGVGHDPVLRDSLVPLACAGTLVIPPADVFTGPDRLLSFIGRDGVTILHCTPPLLELLLAAHAAAGDAGFGSVRLMISAGAPLLWGTVRRLREITDALVVNAYGATETPQIASCEAVSDDGDSHGDDSTAGIGTGVGGAELLLTDPQGRIDTVARGEIVVRSRNLARGYLPGTERDDRFLPDPRGVAGFRAYRTGDLGERGGGGIHVVGRLDRQMLINGYRIEPAEIERAALRHPAVSQAAAGPVLTPTGDLIELCVVLADHAATDPRTLRGYLRTALPGFAVPSRIKVVPCLALNANHKVRPV